MSTLARQIPGFDTTTYDSVEFCEGSAEVKILERHYAPLKFKRIAVNLLPPFRLLQAAQQDSDIIDFSLTMRGPMDELIKHRFAHPSWRSLPPCGVARKSTEGFGYAYSIRRRAKSGDYTLSYLSLDHALDLLLPLSALWLPRVLGKA